MATVSEIVGDPRFQKATPEQKMRLVSRASDSGYNQPIDPLEQTGETSPTGQRLLENAGIVAGGYGVGNLASTGAVKLAESNLGKAILNSPKALGKQYAAQDAAVGVNRTIPETGPRAVFEDPYKYPSQLSKPKYVNTKSPAAEIVDSQGRVISPIPSSSIEATDAGPTTFSRPRPTTPAEALPTTIPEKIPKNFAGFKKFADSRIDKFGDQLTPQELMNYKVHLETQMSDGSIPKFNDQGKITTIYQQASDLRSKVASTFKDVMDRSLADKELPVGVMDTRTQLDKVNTLSNSIRDIPRKVASGTKKAAKVGALIGTGYTLAKALE